MIYRRLGSPGLLVSAIGLGTMSWPFCDYAEAAPAGADPGHSRIDEMVGTALDCGINLFDTAEAYGCFRAETLLGESLHRLGKRQQAVIVTKVGPLVGRESRPGRPCDLSASHLAQRCEASLARLQTDHIDLYLAHWPDPQTPVAETIGAMKKLQQQGKIRYFGVSNFSNDLLGEGLRHGEIAANQLPYNLLEREIDPAQRSFCLENHVGIMAYSPLGKGILTGKYDEDHLPPESDYRRGKHQFSPEKLSRHFAIARECRRLAAEVGVTPSQLAMAWCMAQPGVTTAVPGAKNTTQIRDNARAGSIDLPPAVMQELTALS